MRVRVLACCIAFGFACGGRSEPLPGWVFEVEGSGGAAGSGAPLGGAAGAGGRAEPNAGVGGDGRAGIGGGGRGGEAGRAGAGMGGRAGVSGSDPGGAPPIDRCATPGPPPAVGSADGSDYHLGTPLDLMEGYPTYDYVALGDVNGDGRPDFLGNAYDDLHLYLSVGPGMLGGLQPIEIGVRAGIRGGALLTDVNGDGALDIVVGHALGTSVAWNDGEGVFARSTFTQGPPTAHPAVVDFDRDGDLDIVGHQSDFSISNEEVIFYRNEGSAFSVSRLDLLSQLYRLRVADVTGDGLPDLLVGTGPEPSINVYAQNTAGAFELSQRLTAGSGFVSELWFETTDLDDDGLVDIVAVQDEDEPDVEHVWVGYQRDGDLGPLQRLVEIPKDGGNIAGGDPRIADVNLDGLVDIAFSSSAFDMVVVLRGPNRTFREVHTAFPDAGSIYEQAIAIADVNCDGCPDLLGAQVGSIVLFPGVGCAR